MFSPSADFIRVDRLTGCKNFLGFLEDCMEPDPLEKRSSSYTGLKISPGLVINTFEYSAVLFVWMNGISLLNHTKGFSHGDSAIRWMGILLQEETGQPVYRLWGTEFAVFLKLDNDEAHRLVLNRILERMDREARLLEFPGAPADVALIFNDQSSTCLDSLLMQMGEAMARIKTGDQLHHMIFNASDFKIPAWTPASDSDISFAVRWIARASIFHVIAMGKNLDMAQQEALTDDISNLPNMRAALAHIHDSLQNAQASRKPLSIIMIDGDNIREYNNRFNYAAGDQMISDLSAVLKQNLRPDDFVARWRNGDEFIVTLPNTTIEDAQAIGERFRLAVKSASRTWKIPTTISIGVSNYPAHGDAMDALIDKTEAANKRAKQQGKDQVVLAE